MLLPSASHIHLSDPVKALISLASRSARRAAPLHQRRVRRRARPAAPREQQCQQRSRLRHCFRSRRSLPLKERQQRERLSTRKSTSGGAILQGNCCLKSWSKRYGSSAASQFRRGSTHAALADVLGIVTMRVIATGRAAAAKSWCRAPRTARSACVPFQGACTPVSTGRIAPGTKKSSCP